MGYLNNQLGYPGDLLQSRAIIKKGVFALIPPDGLVKNVIPGFTNCDATILSSPKLGASFVDYVVTMHGSSEIKGFGGDGVECFAYIISGRAQASVGGQAHSLEEGSYIYTPPTQKLTLASDGGCRVFLYKRRYRPLEGHTPYLVVGSKNGLQPVEYEGMSEVLLYNFLPQELAFDMNFHILSFRPGASHGYIETHVQEHGAYVLTGQGMYNLDNTWMPVKKGDYIFMAAYTHQAAYGIGTEESFSYIYSKDCHRDEDI